MKKVFILFSICLTFQCIGQTIQNNTTTKNNKQLKATTKYDNGWLVTKIKDLPLRALFYDDYSSIVRSDSLWDLFSGENSSSKIINNSLNVHFKNEGMMQIRVPLIFPPPVFKLSLGYDFEIKTLVDSKSNAIFEGIIFDFEDSRNYRSITFNKKLKMMVYEKHENGIITEDDEAHDINTNEDSDNELRLIKYFGRLKVFLNGVEAYELKNAHIAGNIFGLIAGGGENMNDALFKIFYVNIGNQPSAGFENNKK